MSAHKKYNLVRGSLEVFCGPMYAGKTSNLLKRVLWLDHQQKKVLVLKPASDNRYSEDHIVTHNKLSYPSVSFTSFSEVDAKYNIKPYNYHTVFLDEVQFLDPKETLEHVNQWLSSGVNVVAGGLDQDSQGQPFETTSLLMGLADSIEKIKASCTVCGRDATKTFRVSDHGERLIIGSFGIYEPRCVEHWSPK